MSTRLRQLNGKLVVCTLDLKFTHSALINLSLAVRSRPIRGSGKHFTTHQRGIGQRPGTASFRKRSIYVPLFFDKFLAENIHI